MSGMSILTTRWVGLEGFVVVCVQVELEAGWGYDIMKFLIPANTSECITTTHHHVAYAINIRWCPDRRTRCILVYSRFVDTMNTCDLVGRWRRMQQILGYSNYMQLTYSYIPTYLYSRYTCTVYCR